MYLCMHVFIFVCMHAYMYVWHLRVRLCFCVEPSQLTACPWPPCACWALGDLVNRTVGCPAVGGTLWEVSGASRHHENVVLGWRLCVLMLTILRFSDAPDLRCQRTRMRPLGIGICLWGLGRFYLYLNLSLSAKPILRLDLLKLWNYFVFGAEL